MVSSKSTPPSNDGIQTPLLNWTGADYPHAQGDSRGGHGKLQGDPDPLKSLDGEHAEYGKLLVNLLSEDHSRADEAAGIGW